jgi:hypothetical protein
MVYTLRLRTPRFLAVRFHMVIDFDENGLSKRN